GLVVVQLDALVLGEAVTRPGLDEQALAVGAHQLVAVSGRGRPLVFVGAVAVALAAQRAVVVAAGVAADAGGGVGSVAARALHPLGAGVLAPGAEGELAAGVAVVQVELADEGRALGVALGRDHAQFALAAPALLLVRVHGRDQVRPRLRGAGERDGGEEPRGEQGGAERWHGGCGRCGYGAIVASAAAGVAAGRPGSRGLRAPGAVVIVVSWLSLHRGYADACPMPPPPFISSRRLPMEITDARVASIHYTLTDDDGKVIDKSPESQPLSYFHGAGNIVPGLEKALSGKQAGDSVKVDVEPEEGYGPHNAALVKDVPRELFQGVDKVEPGMQFHAQSERGPLLVTVVEAGDETVRIDGNHPLAGK